MPAQRLWVGLLLVAAASAYAQPRGDAGTQPSVAGAAQAKPPASLQFDPPPVPEFMLRPSAKPLDHEEMVRQAEEAARRARAGRAAADTIPDATQEQPKGKPQDRQ